MAQEKYIRKKATKKLKEDGWVLSVPCRSRYGTFRNHFPDKDQTQGDDLFEIFDLVAWKNGEIFFLQYTSKNGVSSRMNKIRYFLEINEVEIPKGCKVEVWGYEDRKGFTRKEKI